MSSLLTTFAADVCKCIDTNMFGRVCSTGSGNEIYYVLNIVINVLTAGIGILAVIGIAYFGVQYLTAKDDPAQVKKAKSRLMAIIIGLAAYATIYAGLYFLLPNFTAKSGSFDTCTEASQGDPHQVSPSKPDTPGTPDTPDIPDIPETPGTGDDKDDPEACSLNLGVVEKNARVEIASTSPVFVLADTKTSTGKGLCEKPTSKANKIANTAVMMAWPYSDSSTDGDKVGKCVNGNGSLISYGTTQAKCNTKTSYNKSTCCANSLKPQNVTVLTANGIKSSRQLGWAKDCAKFVGAAVKYAGVDPDFPTYYTGSLDSYLSKQAKKSNGKWEQIENKGSTRGLEPGDVFVYPSKTINGTKVYGHTMIFVGSKGYKSFNMTEASLNKRVARTTSATFKLTYNGKKVNYHIYRIK